MQSCSVIAGYCDYILRIVCRSLKDYEIFLKRHLRNGDVPVEIESMIVLKDIDCSQTMLS